MIIEHDTEELRKLEMERQEMWNKLKKALRAAVDDPAHKTISDLQESLGPIDLESLRNLAGKK